VSDRFNIDRTSELIGESFAASYSPPLTSEPGIDTVPPFGVDGDNSPARDIAKAWRLPYLEDERLIVDLKSVARVGIEDVRRLGAVPVRCEDGSLCIALAQPADERFAAVREHFSTDTSIGIVSQEALARLLEAADAPVSQVAPWRHTFQRVVELFDAEASRVQTLRAKVDQLGAHMSQRELRLEQLETELAQARVDRLRDQETIERLRHDLADRDGRLDRARTKALELGAIIDGGGLR
jgi:MshEN domain